MDQDLKLLISSLLDAINYTDNKETFTNKYLDIIYSQAVLNLIQSLSKEKQEEIKNKLSQNKDDKAKMIQILNEYFSHEQIEEVLTNSSKEEMISYIESIRSSLSDTQKQNLIQLIEKYKPQNQSSS